ncbi:hypothetical protein KXQ82_08025 [Mucilaginibacter sp. HMF5004]|uniref:type IX secretion system protein PorG n=1 Tax=Mucilaginibacter rivuli TaxID=2857527 RepID=UPI001C5FD02C|nr:DUF6089 family protein [Mucilaginibacter rivuli]MBW4889659.1 hypothetical protein [Mucilaginibacter rivuli]
MPKFLFAFILFSAAVCTADAQTWEIGGTIGAAGYIGDFNPSNPVKFSGISGGAFVKRNFNGYLSAKLSYMYGLISGADSLSTNQQYVNRNLSFSSSISEISLIGEFNFIKYIPDIGENKFTPYIFAGVATTAYNPKASYKGLDYELRPLTTEGQQIPYKGSTIAIPYGAGIKVNVSGAWNLIADIGYRSTFTPYLDDVAEAYADKSKLSGVARTLSDRSGEKTGVYLGTAGTQRGNYRGNDTYMFFGFTVSYTFITQKCPAF